jgi:hypothetical protein
VKRDTGKLESEIMSAVRSSNQPSKPVDVVKRVSKDPREAKAAREVIRTLVDRGDLRVTLDWKLRAAAKRLRAAAKR